MLVGVFCVLLQLFDLWMYVLAIVLAGTIIRGVQDFRNTFFEIRNGIKKLQDDRRGSGEGEDDDAEMVMSRAPGKITVEEDEDLDDLEVDYDVAIDSAGSGPSGSDVSEV